MTSEDRNRRAKWGHDVPRSWISDFNMTHPVGDRSQLSEEESASSTQQELIERVRAKARRQRLEDLATQRRATQRSIEQTLVAAAAVVLRSLLLLLLVSLLLLFCCGYRY
jgi:hypothetical protein